MTLTSPIITIFGGTGFVGRAIVNQLMKAKEDQLFGREAVIRVATRSPKRAEFLRSFGRVGQVVPVSCDLANAASVERAVAGSTVVINCIGMLTENRKASFDHVQGEIPGVIARAVNATAPGARLIHISAIGADANSASAYARSKAAGEGVLRAITPDATILRPSVIFGPEDKFFNMFARMALLSPALPLIGGGKTKLQPVYIGDVACAVEAALRLPETKGATFELGGPAIYSLRQLIELMLRRIGRSRCLINLPWGLATLKAAVLERLPGKLLTRDQVELLKRDNVASGTLPGLMQLGITPTAVELILPTYLDRFRPRGRFS